MMVSKITHGIKVSVISQYIPENSNPVRNDYVFGYQVTISNQSTKRVQLLRRHWIITNGAGQKKEVKGDGVIGQQPVLHTNGSHTYQSWCPFATKLGMMTGSYTMVDLDTEEEFEVAVPPFIMIHPVLEN